MSSTYVVSTAVRCRLPELDVVCGKAFDLAGSVDDTGSRRARSDINADVMVLLVGW